MGDFIPTRIKKIIYDFFIYRVMKYLYYLNERVGVNQDVVDISDFISDMIHKQGKGKGTYEFHRDVIPGNLNINKITIVYDPVDVDEKLADEGRVNLAALHTGKSKKFKSGNSEIYLLLGTLKKSVIYHELNHALQFTKLGKRMDMKGNVITGSSERLLNSDTEFKKGNIQMFQYLLYRASDTEVNSNVVQFYGQIKGLMEKYINDFRKKNNIKGEFTDEQKRLIDKWKRDYFVKTLRTRNIYNIAIMMEDFDMHKLFLDMTQEDKEFLSYLFKYLKFITKQRTNKEITENEPLLRKFGFIKKMVNKNKQKEFELLSDKELEFEMIKYQNYIRHAGKVLKKKLTKVWAALDDVY